MTQHFIQNPGLLYNAAIRGQVAKECCQASLGMVGSADGADDIAVAYLKLRDVLGHGFTGYRHAVLVDKACFGKFFDYAANAAGNVKVFEMMPAAGAHGTKMGR
jgi:hypothetical protein